MSTGISAVIITHNEAHTIKRCITSMAGLTEEVIVVDSFSTDDTCAIAEGLGAKVVQRAWTGYSDQKNHANSLATHAYILSMDADEALSPQLWNELMQLKRTKMHGAFGFPRLTNYCGQWVKHGGWYPDKKIRLFPREGAYWQGAHVHETLVLPKGLPVYWSQHDLLHFSYRDHTEHGARIEKYSDLHARKMFSEGKRPSALKEWFSPVVKFIQGYVFQLGFLDGAAGWWIAVLSARAVRLKYQKLNALHRDEGT